MEKEKLIDLYKSMDRIRKFEEQASEAFAMGDLQGFVHLYIGEEAVATGACAAISKNDYITSTHRGHGHMLAKGADPNRMMAELCGKATGYCRGKGGSMHISSIDLGMLGANGMVGAGFPLAVGAGMAQKIKKTDNVVVCFFGDGSTNEGLFHESLNAASLYKLPVIFVCENNLYGISTRQDRSMAIIDISERDVLSGQTIKKRSYTGKRCLKCIEIRTFSDPYFAIYEKNHIHIFLYLGGMGEYV